MGLDDCVRIPLKPILVASSTPNPEPDSFLSKWYLPFLLSGLKRSGREVDYSLPPIFGVQRE